MASPYDLVDLGDLKSWLDVAGTDDDVLLGQLITQISRAILNILDRPSIRPCTYTEILDGGNDTSILLRHWPVNALLSCCVNGVAIQSSPPLVAGATAQAGFVLDPADFAPPGRMQRLSLRGRVFTRCLQNVVISYSAGYQITGETALVPSAPFNVIAQVPFGAWGSDCGVTYADGTKFQTVAANPAEGQYSVAGGLYTFSGSDAGASIFLTYGYVPADLSACCMDWAAERYSYRARIGQQSKSMGGQETMSFIVKNIPDFVVSALQAYRRVVQP